MKALGFPFACKADDKISDTSADRQGNEFSTDITKEHRVLQSNLPPWLTTCEEMLEDRLSEYV